MPLLSDPLRKEREALRERQGSGARYDAPNAPTESLLLARRGYSYFARKFSELKDEELAGPSLREGWTRSHVIADVSYYARRQAIALKGLREDLSSDELKWTGDVNLAATLPARALRSLFQHTKVHLDVEWRDLANSDWDKSLSIYGEAKLEVRRLPLLCADNIWSSVILLNNGAREVDKPVELRA